MNKEIEIKVEKEVSEVLKQNSIYEDMLGYKNIFNELKKKILKEKYNIDFEIKKKEGYTDD